MTTIRLSSTFTERLAANLPPRSLTSTINALLGHALGIMPPVADDLLTTLRQALAAYDDWPPGVRHAIGIQPAIIAALHARRGGLQLNEYAIGLLESVLHVDAKHIMPPTGKYAGALRREHRQRLANLIQPGNVLVSVANGAANVVRIRPDMTTEIAANNDELRVAAEIAIERVTTRGLLISGVYLAPPPLARRAKWEGD